MSASAPAPPGSRQRAPDGYVPEPARPRVYGTPTSPSEVDSPLPTRTPRQRPVGQPVYGDLLSPAAAGSSGPARPSEDLGAPRGGIAPGAGPAAADAAAAGVSTLSSATAGPATSAYVPAPPTVPPQTPGPSSYGPADPFAGRPADPFAGRPADPFAGRPGDPFVGRPGEPAFGHTEPASGQPGPSFGTAGPATTAVADHAPGPAVDGPHTGDGAPVDQATEEPVPGERSGLPTSVIVGATLVTAALLVLVALSVPLLLQHLRQGGGPDFAVGDCVVRVDGEPRVADCSEPGAFEIVEQVTRLEDCPAYPYQHAITVSSPKSAVFCLDPVGGDDRDVETLPAPGKDDGADR